MNDLVYAAVQNGVILDVFPTHEEALARIEEEKRKDLVSILLKRKLRKLFAKSGDVAIHQYAVLTIVKSEVIK